jgi:hypothetical protein
MAVCCQYLTLVALSSRSALSLLVGALFKMFDLFFNTPRMTLTKYVHSLVGTVIIQGASKRALQP